MAKRPTSPPPGSDDSDSADDRTGENPTGPKKPKKPEKSEKPKDPKQPEKPDEPSKPGKPERPKGSPADFGEIPTSKTLFEQLQDSAKCKAALIEIMRIYYLPCMNALRRSYRNIDDSDASDIVHKMFEKVPQFNYKRDGSARGWMWTVLRNKAKDQFQKKKIRHCEELIPEAMEDKQFKTDCDAQKLRLAIEHVEVRNRESGRSHIFETWRLYNQFNVPAARVAEELNISIANVHARSSRINHEIRAELLLLED